MDMLRIEGKQTERSDGVVREHGAEGEGLLLLGVLAASWMIAIGIGWLIWRMAAL